MSTEMYDPPRTRICLGCGGYLKAHFVDGYCGNGCDIAFEAGKAAGRREAMGEVVAEAQRYAASPEFDGYDGGETLNHVIAWAEERSR